MALLDSFGSQIRLQIEPGDKFLEVGRQTADDPPPCAIVPTPTVTRVVIVSRKQTEIGRRQLTIEVLARDHVRIANTSEVNSVTVFPLVVTGSGSVTLADECILGPGQALEFQLPLRVTRGTISLDVQVSESTSPKPPTTSDELQSLPYVTQLPNSLPSIRGETFPSEFSPVHESDSSLVASIRNSNPDAMFDRLGQLVAVLQKSASAADFEEVIARTSREMVNLDRAAVLKRQGTSWSVAALSVNPECDSDSWRPSTRLLNKVVQDRRTFWGSPGSQSADITESSVAVVAVVAAPILNVAGQVIGAVYGDRRIGFGWNRPAIDKFDAKMIEIMACGVAGGWARMEQEQVAVARRVQFERFVTKEVARRLEDDPDALVGRDAEVTMLFCDIAGFSRVSEKMEPRQTFEWINAVMDMLSQCVLATNGTLVDYVGDELIAMWGAPLPMADHASAAASTAVQMMESLKTLNSQFQLPGGELTQIGIGLNSGTVRVGNTGSTHKLKYGPLGSDVNIASRVQGATRYLRTPILITGATAGKLNSEFSKRRLGSVRLKNIHHPIELYELVAAPGSSWRQMAHNYEAALQAWEQHKLLATIEILSQLVAKESHDGPTMVLLSRAVDAWSRDQHDYDPVWTLPSK